MSQRRRVFFVSDRTGITVEALGSSLLTQFGEIDFLRVTLPFIDSIPKAIQVVAQVNGQLVRWGGGGCNARIAGST